MTQCADITTSTASHEAPRPVSRFCKYLSIASNTLFIVGGLLTVAGFVAFQPCVTPDFSQRLVAAGTTLAGALLFIGSGPIADWQCRSMAKQNTLT